jgi:hypothetical protein
VHDIAYRLAQKVYSNGALEESPFFSLLPFLLLHWIAIPKSGS